jgi:hypothetical protein
LNCTRQWGKSTTTAAAVLHECSYTPHSFVVLIAPTSRQSQLLLRTIQTFAKLAGSACEALPGADPGLQLAEGRVVALPGVEESTRGFSAVTWLVVDEAARVLDPLYYSCRAYLATTNGRVWLLSTPFGKRGFFYEESSAGRFSVTLVPASGCARISRAFLAEQKLTLPGSWYAQEYECQFTSVDGGVFDHDLVLASISNEVGSLW